MIPEVNHDITANFHGGDDYSAAAQESSSSEDRSRQRRLVEGWITTRGDATCDEVEVGTGMSHQSCSVPIAELRAAGRLIDTGHRRPTRTGRSARVHAAAPE